MTIATKNGAIIVKGGKVAENCRCCTTRGCVGDYSKFEWISEPPSSTAVSSTVSILTAATPNDVGFCACYWSGLPMTWTLPSYGSDCASVGGVPLAGVRNSRRHITNENGLGPAIPMFEDPLAIPEFRFSDSGGRHRLYATDTSLILEGFSPANYVVIGAHAVDTEGGSVVINGVTIPNGITGGDEYSYRISPITQQECLSLWNAQASRSLQDCDGNRVFDPAVNWSFEFSADAPPITPIDDPFSLANVVGGGFARSFSKSPTRVSIGTPYQFDFGSDGGMSIETFTSESVASQVNNSASPACDACKIKFKVNGTVSKTLWVDRINAYVTDMFIFDGIVSKCLTNAKETFAINATRRNVNVGGPAIVPFLYAIGPPGSSVLTITPNA